MIFQANAIGGPAGLLAALFTEQKQTTETENRNRIKRGMGMKVETRVFGEIDIEEDKIITFPNGIIGFPELTRFTLIHDEERGTGAGIRWLQSLEETGFAMPVMDPLAVKDNYNPQVNDELLEPAGDVNADNMLVLVTVTIPSDIKQMTVNLRGPIIINAEERKACQIIVDGEDYPVKYPIYEILQARKAGA